MANSQDRLHWLTLSARAALAVVLATAALAIVLTVAYAVLTLSGDMDLLILGLFAAAVLAELGLALTAVMVYGLVRARAAAHTAMTVITGRLNRLESVLDASRVELKKMADLAPLSDQAKAMIYRERELEAAQEVVNACLVQQHYEQAEKVIDRLEQQFGYKVEADRLRAGVRVNRDATIEGRVSDAIARVEPIIAGKNWERAMREAQRLLEAFGEHEKVRQLPTRIAEARAEEKRQLLGRYEEAVKRNDIDQSIELLQELDRYLTPQEAAALQESARGVFRAKLNSLGVQFALAVDAKRWDLAVATGEQIMNGYPNSRMAMEVRQKLDQLKQLAAAGTHG